MSSAPCSTSFIFPDKILCSSHSKKLGDQTNCRSPKYVPQPHNHHLSSYSQHRSPYASLQPMVSAHKSAPANCSGATASAAPDPGSLFQWYSTNAQRVELNHYPYFSWICVHLELDIAKLANKCMVAMLCGMLVCGSDPETLKFFVRFYCPTWIHITKCHSPKCITRSNWSWLDSYHYFDQNVDN